MYFPPTVEDRIAEFITSHPRASHPLAPPLWLTSYQLQLLHGRVLHDAVPLRLSTSSISNNSNISLVADILKPVNNAAVQQQQPSSSSLSSHSSIKPFHPFSPTKRAPIPAVAAMLALSPPRRSSSVFHSLTSPGIDTTATPITPPPPWMTPEIEHLLQKAHPADADMSILLRMLEEHAKLLPPPAATSPHLYPHSSQGYRDYYSLVDIAEPVPILEAIDRGRRTIREGKHIIVPSDDDLAAGRFTRQLSWKSLLSLKGSMEGVEESTTASRPWDQLSGTTRLRDYRSNDYQPHQKRDAHGGEAHQQHRHSDDPIVIALGEATPLRPLPKTHYRFDGTPMPDSSQEALDTYTSNKLRSLVVGMGLYEIEDSGHIEEAVGDLSKVFPPTWIPLSAAHELLPYRPIDDIYSYTPTVRGQKGKMSKGGGGDVITGVYMCDGERWYHSSSFPLTQCSRVVEMLLHIHPNSTTTSKRGGAPPTAIGADHVLSPTSVTFLSATRFKIQEGDKKQPCGSGGTVSSGVVEGCMGSYLSTNRCRPIRCISLTTRQPLPLHPSSIIALRKWCWQTDVYTHVWGTEEEYEAVGAPLSGDPIGVYLHDTSGACLGYHYPAVFSTRYEYCLHRTLGGEHTFVKSKDGSLAATALVPTPRKVANLQ